MKRRRKEGARKGVRENGSDDELWDIFMLVCRENDYRVDGSVEDFLRKYFKERLSTKNFGNGRFVRNLFEKVLMVHSKRVVKLKDIEEELDYLSVEDIEEALKLVR